MAQFYPHKAANKRLFPTAIEVKYVEKKRINNNNRCTLHYTYQNRTFSHFSQHLFSIL